MTKARLVQADDDDADEAGASEGGKRMMVKVDGEESWSTYPDRTW